MALNGIILVNTTDSTPISMGYVSNGRVSRYSPYQRTRRHANALKVEFTPATPPTTSIDIQAKNTPVFSNSDKRLYFGAVKGVGSGSSDIGSGSSDYQTLSFTAQSAAPVDGPIAGYTYESTIWRYDATTKALTAYYKNKDTDNTVNASIGIWHDPKSNSEVFILTGDKGKFVDDYGPTVWVTFKFQ